MAAAELLQRRTELLNALAEHNLFQPATVLWRIYEIEAVLNRIRFQGRVVDLGCGDGSLSQVIFQRSAPCTLVGVEPDATDAEVARSLGQYAQVHCAPGDRIPEASGSCDMVFSNSVLEHIPSIDPVLSEVARILRVGGQFVLTVPSEQFHQCLSGQGLLPQWWRLRGQSFTAAIDRRLRHYRYWSPDDWAVALKPLGLEVQECQRYLPSNAVQAWERLANLTGGIAFELFGRRSETRSLQRRMKLNVLEPVIPKALSQKTLAWLLSKHLREPAEITDGGSGGLLAVAVKRSSP